jgi:peptidoglycan/xylan/chitin deacetylase (PgdA/CDA1 family)
VTIRLQKLRVNSESGRALYTGRSDEKLVALTFDDGPKPGVTEPLLDLLTAEHVRATFFVIGRHMQEYPALAKATAAAGMEIANHSYTHRSLTSLTPFEATREMLQTQAAVLALTGQLPRFVRPPGGNWNNRVAAIAREWGLTPCMWSVDVFDSEIISARKVAEAVLTQVKPGSIILMHNGKVSTLQALPTILKELRSRGYHFVTVTELAKRVAQSPAVRTGQPEGAHALRAE